LSETDSDTVVFDDLGLSGDVLKAVADAGYKNPTPIQAQAIPYILMGRDILGCAQTGTGKTASFTLPMIDILAQGRARARMPRSLILTPTRELAAQIAENFEIYGKYNKLTMALLIGGESFGPQVEKLDRGVDVLIATPGRLIDHFERGRILLTDAKILVIDEADRMLDMGFIPDVERIASFLPRLRQTLFFSATFPPEVKRLADQFLMNPKEITVSRTSSPAETVEHFLVYCAGKDFEKREALRNIIASEEVKNALIFCNRKRDVDVLAKSLKTHGFSAAGLHGDMVQSMRTETLESFKAGKITYLVATDVAGRGIDIQGMSHVFNYDVPFHAEDYIHRIGRTGRAGAGGRAFSLATPDDSKYVSAIQHLLGKNITVAEIDGINASSSDANSAERPTRGRGRGRPAPSGRSRTGRGQKRPPAASAEVAPPVDDQKPSTQEDQEAPIQANNTAKESHDPAPAKKPRQARTRRKPISPRKESSDSGSSEKTVAFGDHMPAFLARGSSAPKDD
jgi:superfamily II DNA/RNA helicase